jgi:hypothetical protein
VLRVWIVGGTVTFGIDTALQEAPGMQLLDMGKVTGLRVTACVSVQVLQYCDGSTFSEFDKILGKGPQYLKYVGKHVKFKT